MHFIYLPIFCMCIVFDFSWDHCNAEEKLESMIIQSYGDKQGAFSSKWKWWIYIYYIDTSVFTRKYTTRKIHKNYIRDLSGLFSIISHVSLSMT